MGPKGQAAGCGLLSSVCAGATCCCGQSSQDLRGSHVLQWAKLTGPPWQPRAAVGRAHRTPVGALLNPTCVLCSHACVCQDSQRPHGGGGHQCAAALQLSGGARASHHLEQGEGAGVEWCRGEQGLRARAWVWKGSGWRGAMQAQGQRGAVRAGASVEGWGFWEQLRFRAVLALPIPLCIQKDAPLGLVLGRPRVSSWTHSLAPFCPSSSGIRKQRCLEPWSLTSSAPWPLSYS